MHWFLFLISLCLWVLPVYADSPLTSTPFSDAYQDLAIIKAAKLDGEMNAEYAKFLYSRQFSIDQKAALINALSWKLEGKNNAEKYVRLMYDKKMDELLINQLRPDQLFCIGYLIALDDYFQPEKSFPFLLKAAEELPMSFTVQLIWALARAQKALDSSWCKVWKYTEEVFEIRLDLTMDMRERARQIIYDYLVLYKGYCKGKAD